MNKLQAHLRQTLLAGIFAAVPLVVTCVVIWYVDHYTRFIAVEFFGIDLPLVGVAIALAGVYLGGLIATTLLGRWFIRLIDRLLTRLPGFQQLYSAWKQIALTPGGGAGTFARVVLIADETGRMHMLGFTSGQPISGQGDMLCVFVPNAPNPIQGRLYFVERSACRFLEMTAEEAFKMILSTGNYLPRGIGNGPSP